MCTINYKQLLVLLLTMSLFAACGEYAAVQKTQDFEYKYELAKSYLVDGHYSRASMLFGDVLAVMKGTPYGEECLYLLAMSCYKGKDYESAVAYFKKYYQSYPRGVYVELARYHSAYALYQQTPDVRLDQTYTEEAIAEFQNFLDFYPETSLKEATQEVILSLQDKLVEKEYLSAKLYYDLGTYMTNSAYGGSNYDACVVTAENALKDYPYAKPSRREDLSILILKAKYQLARQSVEEKRIQRFRDAVDEYYSFQNEFPESRYLKEAMDIFHEAERISKKKNINLNEEEEDFPIEVK